MSRKTDISKILTKGSARKRASLLIYHYTVKESIELGNDHLKPILTDNEAKKLFNSFESEREINIYNSYRQLNQDIIMTLKHLYYTGLQFERDYYKFLYFMESNKEIVEEVKKERSDIANEIGLTHSYRRLLNTYTALKVYAKEMRYTNEYILSELDRYLASVQDVYEYYEVEINGKPITLFFKDIEPDYEGVKEVLLKEFNYNYEREE